MAFRFQTQGSGRQSRNKTAFFGKRVCQITGLFTRTSTHKGVCSSGCSSVCARAQACMCFVFWSGGALGFGSRCELLRSCTETCLRAPPDGMLRRF